MIHPHPDKAHVRRCIRKHILACKRKWGSARSLLHYRGLIATYIEARR